MFIYGWFNHPVLKKFNAFDFKQLNFIKAERFLWRVLCFGVVPEGRMMSKKDSVCKMFFHIPEHFADTCNGILFDGKNVIDPSELSDADKEYVYITNEFDKNSTVDVAKYWKREGVAIALIIQEEQSYTDYGMVFRDMLTESLAYNKQLKDKQREHKNNKDLKGSKELISGIKKNDKFIPVITIVINLNEERWDGAVTLYEMLKIDKELEKYVSNHRLNLYDYHDYDNFNNFKTDVATAFKALSTRRNVEKLKEIFGNKNEEIKADTMRFIGIMLNMGNVEKYIEKNAEGKEVGRMCKALEDLKLEGKIESIIDIIIHMKNKNKTYEEIEDVVGENAVDIRLLYDTVVSNPLKNAEEIFEMIWASVKS